MCVCLKRRLEVRPGKEVKATGNPVNRKNPIPSWKEINKCKGFKLAMTI